MTSIIVIACAHSYTFLHKEQIGDRRYPGPLLLLHGVNCHVHQKLLTMGTLTYFLGLPPPAVLSSRS